MVAVLPFAPFDRRFVHETDKAVTDRIGCSRRTLVRYRAQGQISEWVADRWCARLGVHPSEIWPEWAFPVDELGVPELEAGDRFCARDLDYRVPAHSCASDGCRCGRADEAIAMVA
jgi:hypothetical protein